MFFVCVVLTYSECSLNSNDFSKINEQENVPQVLFNMTFQIFKFGMRYEFWKIKLHSGSGPKFTHLKPQKQLDACIQNCRDKKISLSICKDFYQHDELFVTMYNVSTSLSIILCVIDEF